MERGVMCDGIKTMLIDKYSSPMVVLLTMDGKTLYITKDLLVNSSIYFNSLINVRSKQHEVHLLLMKEPLYIRLDLFYEDAKMLLKQITHPSGRNLSNYEVSICKYYGLDGFTGTTPLFKANSGGTRTESEVTFINGFKYLNDERDLSL